MNQSYSSSEWLVVDGGSNDGTYEFLSANDTITNFISEKDNGIYDAMNKGTSLATGDYIMYLNAGDTFYSCDSMHQLNEVINGADVIFLGAYFTCQNQPTRYRAPRKIESIWHSVPANHQATVFNRSALGNTPYNVKYKICGDYELIARLFTQQVTSQVADFPLVSFELGGVSTFAIVKLSNEALRVQSEVLKLPRHLIYLSWLRRRCAMYANLLICKIKGVSK